MGLETLAVDTVVGAATDSFGGEFLASDVFADTTTVFDTVSPVSDFASVDAYQQVGSFAGNSEWVNVFQPGSINTDFTGIVVDDFGVPLLPEDVATINNGSLTPSLYDTAYATAADTVTSIKDTASTFTDKLSGYFGGGNVVDTVGNPITGAQIVVDDQGIPLLQGDVAQINRGVLTDPLAGLNPSTVQRTIGQLTGQNVGYGSTPGVPQLINYLSAGGVNNTVGYGVGTPGYAGGYIGTPGIVSGTAGYPSPGITSVGGINTGSLLNNALSLVTGSTSAQAQPINQPGTVTDWNAIPNIEITGVGVNTGNTIVANANLTTSVSANYQEVYNPATGKWDVREITTNTTVASGLTQQDAIIQAQDLAITQPAITVNTGPTGQIQAGAPFDALGNLNPGYIIGAGGVPVFVGTGATATTGAATTAAGTVQALVQQAQQQQTIRNQRQNRAQATDWRVRLRLAPQSNYLYNDPACGPVLYPLKITDGVIFPYTPSIDIGYKANYDPYDLTHSNYRGYFYKGSHIDAVNVRATFTAQDTNEANYLLAVIHFFRSVTKMFYGQDAQRGSPPPLTYLSGLGDFQFNEHPCVVSQFNYNLPADVDYIRAQSTTANGTNLLQNRARQTVANNPIAYALQRLATVGLPKGALDVVAPGQTLGVGNPTYVPTKIDIQLILLPIQSRSQVSQQFSLRNFANGNLLKGGFW